MNDHLRHFTAFLRLTKGKENTSRNLSAENPKVPRGQMHLSGVHI